MPIALYLADISLGRNTRPGMRQWAADLIESLESSAAANAFAYVTSKTSVSPSNPAAHVARFPIGSNLAFSRFLVNQIHRSVLPSREIGIWHYLSGSMPAFLPNKARNIATVHDCLAPHYLDKYPGERSTISLRFAISSLKNTLRKADLVLTPSHTCKRQIVEFARQNAISCPPIKIVPHGSSAERFDNAAIPKRDFVLHLAAPAAHKKTEWLLERWLNFQQRKLDLPPLHLVGTVCDSALRYIPQLRHVTLSPQLPRQDYLRMLAEARALLIPAELEGFGFSALESYYVSTPTCFLKKGAVDELLGGNVPGGFTFEDSDSLYHALANCLALSTQQIENTAVKLHGQYSLRRSAECLVECYREVAALGQEPPTENIGEAHL